MGQIDELEQAMNSGADQVTDERDASANGDEKAAVMDAPAAPVKKQAKKARKKKMPAKKSKSTRRARAALREQIQEPPVADELPDVQAELEANPELQKRNQALGEELLHEVELLIKRLMRLSPAYKTQLAVPQEVQEAIGDNIEAAASSAGGASILKRLQSLLPGEMLDTDTLKGLWTMLKFTGEYQVDVLKRRMKGDYETDEWGMDQEFIDAVRPLFDFMYNKYWRVTMSGLENVPEEGRALLVSNHSGQLPMDGAMLGIGILQNHPASRMMRALYANWFPTLPFVSDILTKTGQVMANDENAERLLRQDNLVAVFPEGYKGVGKLYKDRYHLARFGRGGFVRIALKSKAPMIPVAVVGAEETYISLYKSQTLAKLIGFPYFPISPTFPWLGPLGLIPLPTKWYIDIGEPIHTDAYPEGSENNLMLISQLTDQVRDTVQNMINDRLRQRKSIFMG